MRRSRRGGRSTQPARRAARGRRLAPHLHGARPGRGARALARRAAGPAAAAGAVRSGASTRERSGLHRPHTGLQPFRRCLCAPRLVARVAGGPQYTPARAAADEPIPAEPRPRRRRAIWGGHDPRATRRAGHAPPRQGLHALHDPDDRPGDCGTAIPPNRYARCAATGGMPRCAALPLDRTRSSSMARACRCGSDRSSRQFDAAPAYGSVERMPAIRRQPQSGLSRPRYSGSVSPEPPSSAGTSFIFGSPSGMCSTVSW